FGVDFKIIVKLNENIKIKVGLEDMLNRFLLYYSPQINPCWEPQTTHLVRNLVRDKKNIVVAGAHIGYMFLELISSLSENSKIFAFEPVKYLFERSKENIEINNLENKVFLNQIALSDKSGVVTIYEQDIRSSVLQLKGYENAKKENVEAITLDDFQSREKTDIDFIFLDIEGYELNVLKGAYNILVNQKPDIVFEVSPKILNNVGKNEDEIYQYLIDLGYNLYLIVDNYKLTNIPNNYKKETKLVAMNDENILDYKNDLYYNVFATTNKI
ncbi:FkbM family methyltransferase, partial [Patescibacteria group bacterium]|nr:FkbM family methyltransferase [Patescibacteria group bacterium]